MTTQTKQRLTFENLGQKAIHFKFLKIDKYKRIIAAVSDKKSLNKLRTLEDIMISCSDYKYNRFYTKDDSVFLNIKLHPWELDDISKYLKYQNQEIFGKLRFVKWMNNEKSTAGISIKLDKIY